MSKWPKPESNMIPEGHYVFRFREEPIFEPYTFTDKKTGNDRQGQKITFFAVGSSGDEEFDVRESFFVWDTRYADLCAAVGVEHGKDIKVGGAHFEGEIIHEASKKDPTKVYPRIINIAAHFEGDMEFPEGDKTGDDGCPF